MNDPGRPTYRPETTRWLCVTFSDGASEHNFCARQRVRASWGSARIAWGLRHPLCVTKIRFLIRVRY